MILIDHFLTIKYKRQVVYTSRFFVASLVLGFSVNMKIFTLFTIYLWVIFSPYANQIRNAI